MRKKKSAAHPPVEPARARRWHTHTLEVDLLRQGWRAWISSIEGSYFDTGTRKARRASIMTEGLAQAMAWLISEATVGRRIRRTRRGGSELGFGPGRDVHSRLAESVATSALGLGRDWLRSELGQIETAVAAQVVTAAAADALDDQYAGVGDQRATRGLFLIEIQERLDARAPWLAVAIGEPGRKSLFDDLDGRG